MAKNHYSNAFRRANRNAFCKSLLKNRWFFRLFPLAGLISLAWFLIRVIPKPSRASYPCQRVAAPLASAFVLWLMGAAASVLAFRNAKLSLRRSRWFTAAFCIVIAVACLSWSLSMTNSPPSQAAFIPSDPANSPMGIARGIHPGRVVWVYDPNAANWNGSTGYWWEDANTNQTAVNQMLSRAIRCLAGEKSDSQAWDKIFRHFNQNHGFGDVGYQPGEKIAIKLNMAKDQKQAWTKNIATPSPQMVYALVDHLINIVGISGEDIVLYDSSRYIGDPIVNKIRSNPDPDFQNITYVVSPYYSPTVTPPRFHPVADTGHPVVFSEPDIQTVSGPTYLPTCLTQAKYFINTGLFRGHSLAGITITAKNLFGTLYRPLWASTWHGGWTPGGEDAMKGLHGYAAVVDVAEWGLTARPMNTYNTLVDLMGHEQIGGKTLLYMVDGLYASLTQSKNISRFVSFNNDWTSSLFVSLDQPAVDSVCLDFLRNESTEDPYVIGAVDNYLHEAASRDASGLAPSGTLYDPEDDGVTLPSLGVHEHWNNAADKQYSRNLGTGEGIELVIPFTDSRENADLDMNGKIDNNDLLLFSQQWLRYAGPFAADVHPPAGDGAVNLADFATLAAQQASPETLQQFYQQWLRIAYPLTADLHPQPADGFISLADFALYANSYALGFSQ